MKRGAVMERPEPGDHGSSCTWYREDGQDGDSIGDKGKASPCPRRACNRGICLVHVCPSTCTLSPAVAPARRLCTWSLTPFPHKVLGTNKRKFSPNMTLICHPDFRVWLWRYNGRFTVIRIFLCVKNSWDILHVFSHLILLPTLWGQYCYEEAPLFRWGDVARSYAKLHGGSLQCPRVARQL